MTKNWTILFGILLIVVMAIFFVPKVIRKLGGNGGGARPTTEDVGAEDEGGSRPAQTVRPAPDGAGVENCSLGNSVSCSQLGAVWSGGSAKCRVADKNYDVSTCIRSRQAELVKPAERDAKQWGDARCNDGTPFAFDIELSPSGKSNDWVLYLKGGGFCDDNAFSCSEREKDKASLPLTSSPSVKDRTLSGFIKNDGIFSRSSRDNPAFYDANLVYGIYCSSDAWAGAGTQPRSTTADPKGWYFSGRTNVKSMVEAVLQRYGLDDNNPKTKVLFAGSSGGGHAVGVNIDTLASLLPQTTAGGRLKVVNDGGTQIDFDDPAHRPGEATVPIRTLWEKAYKFWGAKSNALCDKAQTKAGKDSSYCSFAPLNYDYVSNSSPRGYGVPVLIQESQTDADFMRWHHINKGDSAVEKLRTQTMEVLSEVKWLFSGGTPYHTLLEKAEWTMGPAGKTFRDVLTRFWNGETPERVVSER